MVTCIVMATEVSAGRDGSLGINEGPSVGRQVADRPVPWCGAQGTLRVHWRRRQQDKSSCTEYRAVQGFVLRCC